MAAEKSIVSSQRHPTWTSDSTQTRLESYIRQASSINWITTHIVLHCHVLLKVAKFTDANSNSSVEACFNAAAIFWGPLVQWRRLGRYLPRVEDPCNG